MGQPTGALIPDRRATLRPFPPPPPEPLPRLCAPPSRPAPEGRGPRPGGLLAGVQRGLRPLAWGFAAGQEAELCWRGARPTGSLSPLPSGGATLPPPSDPACASARQLAGLPPNLRPCRWRLVPSPLASNPLHPPPPCPACSPVLLGVQGLGRERPAWDPPQETLGAQHRLLISGMWGAPAQAALGLGAAGPSSVQSQLCPTLCNHTDCSPPGSSVHGILQARMLQWVAFLSSGGSSRPRDGTQASHTAGRFFTD